MESVVGDHELIIVPRSLMTAEGKLLDGGQGKHKLVSEVLSFCKINRNVNTELVDVDMELTNKISIIQQM